MQKKYENYGNNDSILNFRDQRIQEASILASLFIVSWKSCLRLTSFVMASLLTKVFNKETWTIFRFTVGSCWSVPFSPSLWDAVCPLWRLCIGWCLAKPSSGWFSKGSNLRIWEYWPFIWYSLLDDDDVTNVQNVYQMVIRICVRHCSQFDLCHCGLFLINPEMAISLSMWPSFGSGLSIIMKIVYPPLQKYLKLMTISTTAFRKTSPICEWWSPTLRKQMKPLNSKGFTPGLNMFMKAIRVVVPE